MKYLKLFHPLCVSCRWYWISDGGDSDNDDDNNSDDSGSQFFKVSKIWVNLIAT